MSKYPMITISREYGSNGHKIGELLSQKLGIPFYDKDVIAIAAKEAHTTERTFEEVEATAAGTTLGYAFSNRSNRDEFGMPVNDRIYYVQSSVIRTLADQGPAIFVGRCADAVLAGYKRTIDIFLWANEETRTQTIMYRENLSHAAAEAIRKRYDKGRATYYNYYTDRKWGDLKNYDMSLNVSHLTPEEAADLLAEFINHVVEKTDALNKPE